MISRALFLLLIPWIIFSCSKNKPKLYEFDPRNLIENNVTLDEIADDIKYIPLDNTYPISYIFDFYFINDYIYLSAKKIGVLRFDSKGKLVNRIGSIGRGPGEYTYGMNFGVDDKHGSVYVKESGNRIKVYSGNGTFLRSLSIQEYGGTVELISIFNSKLFLFNYLQFDDAKYNWVILDTLCQLLKTRKRAIPIFHSGWGGRSGNYFLNNKLNYWNIYNDTIYTILPDLTEKAVFFISPGDYRFPRADIDRQKLSQYVYFHLIFETKKFIEISYYFNETSFVVLIEKNSGKSLVSKREKSDACGIINNIDDGVEFIPTGYYNDKSAEYMVGSLDAYQLKMHVASDVFKNSKPRYPEKKEKLEALASSLNETSNPILMMVKLKK